MKCEPPIASSRCALSWGRLQARTPVLAYRSQEPSPQPIAVRMQQLALGLSVVHHVCLRAEEYSPAARHAASDCSPVHALGAARQLAETAQRRHPLGGQPVQPVLHCAAQLCHRVRDRSSASQVRDCDAPALRGESEYSQDQVRDCDVPAFVRVGAYLLSLLLARVPFAKPFAKVARGDPSSESPTHYRATENHAPAHCVLMARR